MNEMRIGQVLEWKVAKPTAFPLRSPTFFFHGFECYMELLLTGNKYQIYIRSKNTEEILPPPLYISSYIEIGSKPICFYKESIELSTHIGMFNFSTINEKLISNSNAVCTFIFIFHGDIGTTQDEYCFQKFSQDTSRLLDEALFYDVQIKCGEQDIKAHRNILSTRSQVFSKMFQNDTLERQTGKVEIKAMDSDIFKLLLRYLYSGKLPQLTSGNAADLYEAGDRYEVLELRDNCAKFLIKSLTPEKSCDMLIFADAHSDEDFKKRVIDYMGDKKVPLNDDMWQDFCNSQPKLGFEVLNTLYKQQNKK